MLNTFITKILTTIVPLSYAYHEYKHPNMAARLIFQIQFRPFHWQPLLFPAIVVFGILVPWLTKNKIIFEYFLIKLSSLTIKRQCDSTVAVVSSPSIKKVIVCENIVISFKICVSFIFIKWPKISCRSTPS